VHRQRVKALALRSRLALLPCRRLPLGDEDPETAISEEVSEVGNRTLREVVLPEDVTSVSCLHRVHP